MLPLQPPPIKGEPIGGGRETMRFGSKDNGVVQLFEGLHGGNRIVVGFRVQGLGLIVYRS